MKTGESPPNHRLDEDDRLELMHNRRGHSTFATGDIMQLFTQISQTKGLSRNPHLEMREMSSKHVERPHVIPQLVMRLVVVLLVVLAKQAGGTEESDEIYDPDVEPSDLERHQFVTHSAEGSQFDFVRKEAQEQKERGHGSGGEALGIGNKALLEMLKQLAKAMDAATEAAKISPRVTAGAQSPPKPGSEISDELQQKTRSQAHAAKRKPKPNPLPRIEVGTPVSEVLRQIRLSLEAADPEPRAVAAGLMEASADDDEDDEDDEDDPLSFIDYLDARGLRLLEVDLERQLRRIRRRRGQLGVQAESTVAARAETKAAAGRAASARTTSSAAASAAASTAAASRTAAAGTGGGGATPTLKISTDGPLYHGRTLGEALAAALRGGNGRAGRRLEDAIEGSDDGDAAAGDATARYEARLKREAQARRRAERGESDDTDEEGSAMQAMPFHEVIAKMFGSEADSDVVQTFNIQVVTGGEEDDEAGQRPVKVTVVDAQGGSLEELLAKATSSLAKSKSKSKSSGEEEVVDVDVVEDDSTRAT